MFARQLHSNLANLTHYSEYSRPSATYYCRVVRETRGRRMGGPVTHYFTREFETLLNVLVRLVPSCDIAPTAATAIRAAIKPYSIAVAPLRSEIIAFFISASDSLICGLFNILINLNIVCLPCQESILDTVVLLQKRFLRLNAARVERGPSTFERTQQQANIGIDLGVCRSQLFNLFYGMNDRCMVTPAKAPPDFGKRSRGQLLR